MIRVGDRIVLLNSHFRMALATKASLSEVSPDTYSQLSVVNFHVTPTSLEEQLLNHIVVHEKPYLEEQRTQLVMSNARDMELKSAIQERILGVRLDLWGTFQHYSLYGSVTYHNTDRKAYLLGEDRPLYLTM